MNIDPSRILRTASCFVLAASVIAAAGCDSGDTTPPPQAARPSAPANAPPASTGPTVTADLPKISKELADAFLLRAIAKTAMASGKTLSAAESTGLWQAQADTARICNDISQMVKQNPRWKRQVTEALEKYTKAQIIKERKAAKALDAARKKGTAGKPTGTPPEDLMKVAQKHGMAEMQVLGMMSYTKAEMDAD